jgi:hypothetical protein
MIIYAVLTSNVIMTDATFFLKEADAWEFAQTAKAQMVAEGVTWLDYFVDEVEVIE